MGAFADSVRKSILATKQEMNQEALSTAQLLFNKAVDYSPTQVDAEFPGAYATGLFANSWQVAINSESSTVGTIADESASESRRQIRELEKLKSFQYLDGYITLVNNQPYADNVEYSGWPQPQWSGMIGPYAPVRNSITYVQGVKKV